MDSVRKENAATLAPIRMEFELAVKKLYQLLIENYDYPEVDEHGANINLSTMLIYMEQDSWIQNTTAKDAHRLRKICNNAMHDGSATFEDINWATTNSPIILASLKRDLTKAEELLAQPRNYLEYDNNVFETSFVLPQENAVRFSSYNIENDIEKSMYQIAKIEKLKEDLAPLLFEVKNNNLKEVKNLLKKHTTNKNIEDSLGHNAVFYAVMNQNLKMLKLLSDFEVKMNQQNNDGSTPLLYAIWKGNFDIVKWLLKRISKPYNINNCGHDPLFYAIIRNDIKSFKLLSSQMDCLSHRDINGRTNLMYAIWQKNMDMIKTIIQKDEKQLFIADINGYSPLSYAHNIKTYEIADLFVKKGADTNDLRNYDGKRRRELLNELDKELGKKNFFGIRKKP